MEPQKTSEMRCRVRLTTVVLLVQSGRRARGPLASPDPLREALLSCPAVRFSALGSPGRSLAAPRPLCTQRPLAKGSS